MPSVNPGTISWSISHMLDVNKDQINSAVQSQSTIKGWFIVGAAIVAVILIVKRMA